MKIDEVVTLIKAVSKEGITSFVYQNEEVKIKIKKEAAIQYVTTGVSGEVQNTIMGEVTTASTAVASTETKSEGKEIHSPLVGVFYSASSPEAEPFVKLGDTVKKGQVLGIVEAMKLMNEIESEFDGTVEEILINNEETVEYGQVLFRIK